MDGRSITSPLVHNSVNLGYSQQHSAFTPTPIAQTVWSDQIRDDKQVQAIASITSSRGGSTLGKGRAIAPKTSVLPPQKIFWL